MEFKDWFFKQFPEVYQSGDSYKDTSGEGLLQRYLRTFGLELDDEIVPYIINFSDIWDYQVCEAKFLPLIATLLGSPPSFDSDADNYRKVLAYAVAIYKVKGTIRAYQIMMGIMGFSIDILFDDPKVKITYDEPVIYDEEPDPEQYDSECDYCTDYWIAYNKDNEVADPDILAKLANVICFLQPINAKFQGWILNITLEDIFSSPLADDLLKEIS